MQTTANKILIVGASGNVASHIARNLAGSQSVRLRLTSSRPEGLAALSARYPNADVVLADWLDKESLICAFEGVDRVVAIPPDFVVDETKAVSNIVAAHQANPGVRQIVRLLSVRDNQRLEDVSEEQQGSLAGSALHLMGKSLLDRTDLPLTYLNFRSWFTSNITWFIADDVKHRGQIRLPGDVPRRWICVQDMADCFVKVLEEDPAWHVGKHYRMSGDELLTFAEIANIISNEIERDITFAETDESLRASGLGSVADYIMYESSTWEQAVTVNDFSALMGREPTPLSQWIHQHRSMFQH